MSLMVGAIAQMAQYYNLPFFGTAGCTDAKFCDAQAAVEATLQCFSSAAIGSGLVHDCSSWMDHGSLVSPAFMVLVNEILHNVNQFMNGLPVTEETLAVDLIDRVGPGGHYLQEEHTLKHFRDVRYSKLFERMIYDQWKKAGAKRFEERLREITKEAMAHRPEPLASEVIKELDRMQAHWEYKYFEFSISNTPLIFILQPSPPESEIGLCGFMRRLLTGCAISYNRRHRRWGPLFQNRLRIVIVSQNLADLIHELQLRIWFEFYLAFNIFILLYY